jgi:hypothetical protein
MTCPRQAISDIHVVGWSSVQVTYLMVSAMGFVGEDLMCPVVNVMFLLVAVLCHWQLFGLSGVDVLVVFFYHVFSGVSSLSHLDLATSMGNTVLCTPGFTSPRMLFTGQRKLVVFLGSRPTLLMLCVGMIVLLLTCWVL